MKFLYQIIVLSLVITISSCTTNSDSSDQIVESSITQITSPERAISDDNVKIIVNFTGGNGCSEAYNIKADKVGQTITLRAYAKYPGGGIACTEILKPLQLDYTFFADLPGTYFFVNASDNSIADTLGVY